MVKIAAILGLIVAGITISIFMVPAGPCDPIKNPVPPPFNSARGEGAVKSPLDWVRDIKCRLSNPSGIPEVTQSTSTAEPSADSSTTSSGTTKTKLKVAFTKGSLRKLSKIEIRGNVPVEIKKDGTSSENLFDWLPIKVVLKAGSQKVWETEITRESGCREAFHNQSCVLSEYKYEPVWDGKKLYLYAYDKDGKWIGFHYEE